MEVEHADHARIMATNTQKVTARRRCGRKRPAGAERASAPTSGPRKAYCRTLMSGKRIFDSSGKAAEIADEGAEGAGVEPAHDPVVVRWKITDWSAKEARIEAMSFMPNQAAKALAR
jgi:hypothetical protein